MIMPKPLISKARFTFSSVSLKEKELFLWYLDGRGLKLHGVLIIQLFELT